MKGLLTVRAAVQVQRFALSAFLAGTWTADAVEGLDLSMFPDVVFPSLIATGMADLFSATDEVGCVRDASHLLLVRAIHVAAAKDLKGWDADKLPLCSLT